MAQGRIKRLQSAARAQPLKLAEISVCTLCDRPIPLALRDAHHLRSAPYVTGRSR